MEINPVGGNGPPLKTSGKVKVKVRVKGDRTDTCIPEEGIFTMGMEFEVLEGASVPMIIGSNSMLTLGIEAELVSKVAYIGNDQMKMKILTPHIPWEEVRHFINKPILVSLLQKGDRVAWSINLRPGARTRSSSATEGGRISQMLHKKLVGDYSKTDHPKASKEHELWRCRGIGDTSRWDENVGIGKSMLQTEAIAGKHAGNGVFFRKDLASGTIVCPYEGRQIKPSEADEQAKRSRFVYQDRSGTTVDGDPDLSYGPTINDGVNFFWDNVKIQKKSDGKLYVVTTKAV
jgi:hypothetical protein